MRVPSTKGWGIIGMSLEIIFWRCIYITPSTWQRVHGGLPAFRKMIRVENGRSPRSLKSGRQVDSQFAKKKEILTEKYCIVIDGILAIVSQASQTCEAPV